jgi:hypothetical protein
VEVYGRNGRCGGQAQWAVLGGNREMSDRWSNSHAGYADGFDVDFNIDVEDGVLTKHSVHDGDGLPVLHASSFVGGPDVTGIHSGGRGHPGKCTKFVVVSWNTAGMRDDSIDNIVAQLEIIEEPWDAILVQEGPKSEECLLGNLESGHIWYVAPCADRHRSVAILVHRRWGHLQLDFKSVSGRVAYVDFDSTQFSARLITAHMPHSDYDDTEVESVLHDLSCLRAEATSNRKMCIYYFGC